MCGDVELAIITRWRPAGRLRGGTGDDQTVINTGQHIKGVAVEVLSLSVADARPRRRGDAATRRWALLVPRQDDGAGDHAPGRPRVPIVEALRSWPLWPRRTTASARTGARAASSRPPFSGDGVGLSSCSSSAGLPREPGSASGRERKGGICRRGAGPTRTTYGPATARPGQRGNSPLSACPVTAAMVRAGYRQRHGSPKMTTLRWAFEDPGDHGTLPIRRPC